MSLSNMSDEEVAAKLKELVIQGEATPALDTWVPSPIVDALGQLGINGEVKNVVWPGPGRA